MARYIDADALIEMLNIKAKTDEEIGLYNHLALTQSFITFVERQPTADVVPKSEVERWKENFQILDAECSRLEKYEANYYNEVIKAKAEAAREIFEEIEKQIDLTVSVIQKILNARGGRSNGNTVLLSKYDMIMESKKFIAELKKKYTEEE